MKYASVITSECYNGPGWGATFALQGCPHHCPGCFNPETWDFSGGKEFTPEILNEISIALSPDYITRLSIQGGEPLCQENLFLTALVCEQVRAKYPNKKIYLWTGYTKEELETSCDPKMKRILDGSYVDVLIDGPFIQAEKDTTLFMRGSKNQRIIELT
jgi:anaerobic ribonucleoside-triphosphate reductase activating protein